MWTIMGAYQGNIEEIDEAGDKAEAYRLLSEYRAAFGGGWALWVKRSRRR